MKIKYISLLIISLISIKAFSQFSVDGEFRTRFNIQHGFKTPALNEDAANFFLDQRSRISATYNGEKYSTKLTLQDAKLWGSNDMHNKTGSLGNSYSLGAYEAWVDVKLNPNFNLKIGRQEWNYNDKRILASRNIWTSGLTYDGLLLIYSNPDKQLVADLGLSYNNDGPINGMETNNEAWVPERLKTMNFLNIQKGLSDKLTASIMLSLSGKVDTANNALLGTGTHGLFLVYNKGQKAGVGLFGTLSGYYQQGSDLVRDSESNYRKISAYLIAGEIGFRTLENKLEVSAGAELISGKDYTNTDADYNSTRHSFDMLYGGRFPYYGGNMNHFLIQDSYLTGTKGGGYANPYVKLIFKPNSKSIFSLEYFMPYLTTPVTAHVSIDPATNKPSGMETDTDGNTVYWEGNLGNYLDLGWSYKFNKEISLETGLSYAMISDIKNQMVFGYKDAATKELHESNQNFYFWVMLTFKPKFFKN